jgi:hypothetical protein
MSVFQGYNFRYPAGQAIDRCQSLGKILRAPNRQENVLDIETRDHENENRKINDAHRQGKFPCREPTI